VARKLGAGGHVQLQWPPYFEPTVADAQAAAGAASAAKLAGILDTEHAAKYAAPFFGVEDVQAMLRKAAEEQKAKQAELEQQMMAGMGGGPGL
jgi:hypothetical protein